MKTLLTIFLLTLTGIQAALADVPAGWSTNYNDLISSTTTNQAPALLYFTASWCGPCKLMTRTTLADPAVVEVLSNIDHVALDIDEHSDTASQYGVDAVPTFIILSAGHEINRTTGYRPTDEFLEWLTNGVNEAHAAVVRQNLSRAELTEVDHLLASTDTNSTCQAAAKLFDLCAEHEAVLVSAAVKRLRILAARDPMVVLDGLNDSRLAVRIQSANVLHDVIGDRFDVDPWCDAAARLKAAGVWREKLAKQDAPAP